MPERPPRAHHPAALSEATPPAGPGGPFASGSSHDEAWDALKREVAACTRCALHRTRTHTVFYRGATRPRVVFVGEAPGVAEDRVGDPFVGRAGKQLDAGIATARIPPDDHGMLNVLKCRPPSNRFDPRAATTCKPYLDRQISLLDPELLVPLGRWAVATLFPEAGPITRAAGVAFAWEGRRVLPLLHPAATFRSRSFRRRWDADLETLAHEYRALVNQTL